MLPLTAPFNARKWRSRRTNAAFFGSPAVAASDSIDSCTAMAIFSRQPESLISFCTVSNCLPLLFINDPIASNASALVSIAESSAKGCCSLAWSSIAFTFSTTCAFWRSRSCRFFLARIELPPVEVGGAGRLAENSLVSRTRPSCSSPPARPSRTRTTITADVTIDISSSPWASASSAKTLERYPCAFKCCRKSREAACCPSLSSDGIRTDAGCPSANPSRRYSISSVCCWFLPDSRALPAPTTFVDAPRPSSSSS